MNDAGDAGQDRPPGVETGSARSGPAPSQPNSTEDRLSDVSCRGDGPLSSDLPASIGLISGAIGLASLCAVQLAAFVGFPGTTPHPEIVGWLAEHDYDKARESGLFYYTLLLAPCFAWIAMRIARRPGVPGSPWIFLGGAVAAAVSVLGLVGRAPTSAATAIALVALAVGLTIGSRPRLGSSPRFLARIGGRLLGHGATIAAAVSMAIAGLAAGPRVIKPEILSGLGLVTAASRTAGVLLAALLLVSGLGVALRAAGFADDRVRRALRHGVWLIAIRIAPGEIRWIAGLVGVAVLLAIWELRRPGRSDDEEASLRADGRFFRWIFLPALVAMLVFHHDVNGTIDTYHSGEWLSPASEMLRGKRPFGDIYLQHGLVQNALRTFFTFELFEPTFEMDRLSLNLFYGVSHAVFLLMGLSLFASPWTAVVLTLVLATPGLFVQPRLIGLFVALACVLVDLRQARGIDGTPTERRSRWPLIGAGAAVAVAAFWSLDSGVYAAGTVGLFLALEAWGRDEPLTRRATPFVWVAIGGAAATTPFVTWLAASGTLPAFVENSRRQVEYQLSVWGIPFPPLSELAELFRHGPAGALGDGRFVALAAALTVIVCAVTLTLRASHKRLSRFGFQVLLLTIGGALVYRTALGRSDPSHLAFVKALFWPLVVRLAEHVAMESRLPRLGRTSALLVRAAPLAIVAVYFVTCFVPLYGVTRHWLRMSEVRATRPGGGFERVPLPRMGTVLIPRWQAQALTSLAAYVDERLPPGETFVDFSNMGAVYFLLDRPSPSRYLFAVYAATHEMQREMIDDLEETRPPLLIVSDVLGLADIDRVSNERRHPLLAEYLGQHYELDSHEAFGTVYARAD